MKPNIHPDARTRFSELGNELLEHVDSIPERDSSEQKNRFRPDIHISEHLTGEDIKNLKVPGAVDSAGNEVARFFRIGKKQYGFEGAEYAHFRGICDRMCLELGLHSAVSQDTTRAWVADWIEAKLKNETDRDVVAWIEDLCESHIESHEIWVPIYGIALEVPVQIGNCTLHTITKDLVDSMLDWEGEEDERSRKLIEEYVEKQRKRLQGHCAAVTVIEAERIRAAEIALQRAEQAVAVMRLWSPGILFPTVASYWSTRDRTPLDTEEYFAVKDGRWAGSSSRLHFSGPMLVPIAADTIEAFKTISLADWSRLLCESNRTEYQDSLIASMELYSRAALNDDPVYKVVDVLVAIEHFLLKDEGEPVQEAISFRLAHLVGRDWKLKKEIVKAVKDTYHFRSQFLHHGRRESNLASVRGFLVIASNAFRVLIGNAWKFKTRHMLIDVLDDKKLGR